MKLVSFVFLLSLACLLIAGCTDRRSGAGRTEDGCSLAGDNRPGTVDCGDPSCSGAPACRDAEPSPPSAEGGSPSDDAAVPPSAGTCCVNGQGYRCPTMSAMDRCAGPDPGECFDRCGFGDISCLEGCEQMLSSFRPDPSGCTADATVACTACRGTGSCINDADCISGDHCMDDGLCYSGFAGCPCYPSVDGQCHNGCSLQGECQ
ncbi:MAG: hypothetical protein AAGF12_24885 [Myxococcota bacterium]